MLANAPLTRDASKADAKRLSRRSPKGVDGLLNDDVPPLTLLEPEY